MAQADDAREAFCFEVYRTSQEAKVMTVNVGDVILVTKTFLDCGMYSVGDILEVEEILEGCIRAKGVDLVIGNDEFEVILDGVPQHLCPKTIVGNLQGAY